MSTNQITMKKNHIRLRLISEGIQNILFYMLFPFMTLYLTKAWDAGIVSIALATIAVLGMFSGIWGGILADRLGRKPLIIITSIGFLVATALFIIGRLVLSNLIIYMSFALMSLTYAAYLPVGKAYISDWLDEKEQKKTYILSYQIFSVSVTIGPLIGSFIFDSMPIWFVWISLISAFLLLFISLWGTPEFRGNKNLNIEKKSNKSNFLSTLALIGKDKRLFIFVLASIFAAQAFMQLEILLPSKVIEDLTQGVSMLGISINASQYYASLLMTNGILVVIFGSIIGRLLSKYSTRFSFVGSSLMYALSMIIFSFSQSYIIFFIGIIVFTVAELLVVSTQDAYIAGIATSNQKAQYFAAANMRYSISKIFAPQLLVLVPFVSYEGAFLIAAFSAVLSAFFFLLLFQNTKSQNKH
ncbi:hypothetical protein BAMA_16835 [Bacillus manliponensis]|uniref:Major facilitator superfamily (MFS) profile domain-containing protein n=1 Tax=Bacillus manliponensis TaxID=574376 RepID=A0A073K0T4_9BACI|nr:MFS transporter [Bacillus manliponensis]KEK20115.1 hypothetical protein BAMA_16835 [Bacillus manliponensis]